MSTNTPATPDRSTFYAAELVLAKPDQFAVLVPAESGVDAARIALEAVFAAYEEETLLGGFTAERWNRLARVALSAGDAGFGDLCYEFGERWSALRQGSIVPDRDVVEGFVPHLRGRRGRLIAEQVVTTNNMKASPGRDKHTIVVAADGAGLRLECAWCEVQVGFTDQSGALTDLNDIAETHFTEMGV